MEVPPIPTFEYEPYIETMHDEETGMVIVVHIICVCSSPMLKIKEDAYICGHCDRLCKEQDCMYCVAINSFDYFTAFGYNDEDEEEDDADL